MASRRETTQVPVSAVAEVLQGMKMKLNTAASGMPLLSEDTIPYLEQLLVEYLPHLIVTSASSRRELDKLGTELWNACQSVAESEEDKKLLAKVREFAFAVLEIVTPSHPSGNWRALGVALKAAKACLDTKQLDDALRILGKGAQRLEFLETSSSSIDAMQLRSAKTCYYMLRAQLSWLQGRPDIAEHLFSKVPEELSVKDQRMIAETSYQIGKTALSKGQRDCAVTWLKRALEHAQGLATLTTPLQTQDRDAIELRLLARHALARAYMFKTPESQQSLTEQLGVLKRDHGDSPAVLFLELEIFGHNVKPKLDHDFQALSLAIDGMDYTNENLKLAFHNIKRLKRLCVRRAAETVQFLLSRLPPSQKTEWVERGFINIVSMVTNSTIPNEKRLTIIKSAIETMERAGHGALRIEASHATLIPIWKQVDNAMRSARQGHHDGYELAQEWCRIALDARVFQNCSESNRQKIQRRLVACALHTSNTDLAREILDQIPVPDALRPHEQNSDAEGKYKSYAQTFYLRYKLALSDDEVGVEYISDETTSKFLPWRLKYLQACGIEAQRLNESDEVFLCVSNFWDLNSQAADNFTFPISLLLVEMNGQCDEEQLGLMCNMFDLARCARKFSTTELKWFIRKSFEAACMFLKKNSQPDFINTLLSCSEEFGFIYRDKTEKLGQEIDWAEFQHLGYLCYYVNLLQRIPKARSETEMASKKYCYKGIRFCVHSLRRKYLEQGHEDEMWHERESNLHFIALLADFEAAIVLEHWRPQERLPSLFSVIQEAEYVLDDRIYRYFMGSILRSDAPRQEKILVIKTIISEMQSMERRYNFSCRQYLPHYLRCLFQLAISPESATSPTSGSSSSPTTTTGDLELAETVLDQVILLAMHEAYLASPDHAAIHSPDQEGGPLCFHFPYPAEELVRFATISFNQAADFYRASRDEDCRRWAEKAIQVATLIDGPTGEKLVNLLRERLRNLL